MTCPKCGRETTASHLKWAEGTGDKRHEVWDCPAGNMTEDARRLARYDEAIELLRECEDAGGEEWVDVVVRKVRAFLADEGKVAG